MENWAWLLKHELQGVFDPGNHGCTYHKARSRIILRALAKEAVTITDFDMHGRLLRRAIRSCPGLREVSITFYPPMIDEGLCHCAMSSQLFEDRENILGALDLMSTDVICTKGIDCPFANHPNVWPCFPTPSDAFKSTSQLFPVFTFVDESQPRNLASIRVNSAEDRKCFVALSKFVGRSVPEGLQSFAQLRKLELDFDFDDANISFNDGWARSDATLNRFLKNANNLRHLHIGAVWKDFDPSTSSKLAHSLMHGRSLSFSIWFRDVCLPKLTDLSVKMMRFYEFEILEFLAKHPALKRLHMHDCHLRFESKVYILRAVQAILKQRSSPGSKPITFLDARCVGNTPSALGFPITTIDENCVGVIEDMVANLEAPFELVNHKVFFGDLPR